MSEAILTALRTKLSATLRSVADDDDVTRWLQSVPGARPLGFYSRKASGFDALQDIIDTLFAEDPANLRAFLRGIYVEYAAREDARNGLRGCLRLLRSGEVRTPTGPAAAVPSAAPRPFDFLQPLREPILPAEKWLLTLRERMGQVCMISTAGYVPLGTGFLVGAAHVLTAGHVLRGRPPSEIAGLRFRFDFHERSDGTYAPGTEVRSGAAGVIASAPPGVGESNRTPDTPTPEPNELDFAVVQIDRPVGTERGTIPLDGTDAALAADNGLTLLHFPAGETMRVTFDTDAFTGNPVQGNRMIYANTSRPGSSGAPVLQSASMKLVALHTYGEHDPMTGSARGVPIWLLRNQVEQAVQAAPLAQGVPA